LRRIACILIFLGLAQETEGEMFEGKWESIFTPIFRLLSIKLPIKINLIDALIIAALIIARSRPAARSMRAKPLDKAIWASFAAVAVTWIWGIVINGGNWKVTFVQLRPFVLMLTTVFMLTACLRTPKDFFALGKTIVAAAIYRAAMAWWFYFFVVRGKMFPSPAFMTTHSDTVTFVAGIVLCATYALETRTRKAILFALGGSLFIMVAIQLNNRRLAWVSLMCAILVLYFIYPSNKLKQRLNRRLLLATPLLVVYVIVGTGRSEGIFKPLRSLNSAAGREGDKDPSTRARDFENLGVVLHLQQHPLLSSGWGHEYQPLTRYFTVETAFKETWSIPHNNMLMILCFNGVLGFMGIWIVFPVGMYFAARAYRVGEGPIERTVAASSIAVTIVYFSQVFGDMGFISYIPTYVIASALAAGGRMATFTGAWPVKGKTMHVTLEAAPKPAPAGVTA
jgi:hypothetical protein